MHIESASYRSVAEQGADLQTFSQYGSSRSVGRSVSGAGGAVSGHAMDGRRDSRALTAVLQASDQ